MKFSNCSHPLKIGILRFAAALVIVTSAKAATLAFYDIEASLTVTAGTVDPGLTASTLDATTASGTSTNFEWVGTRVPFYLDAAVADGTNPTVPNIVATWSLTPTSGNQINLPTVGALNYGVLAFSNPAGTYTVTTRIFIASDAAFTNILATSTILSDNAVSSGSTPTLGTVDLDNAVSSTATLYFGLAMVETNKPGTFNARYDGIQVNGTVTAIPEPSAALLGGLGMLALLRRRA